MPEKGGRGCRKVRDHSQGSRGSAATPSMPHAMPMELNPTRLAGIETALAAPAAAVRDAEAALAEAEKRHAATRADDGSLSAAELVACREKSRLAVEVCKIELERARNAEANRMAGLGGALDAMAADAATKLGEAATRHEARVKAGLRQLCGEAFSSLSIHHDLETLARRVPDVSARRELAQRLRAGGHKPAYLLSMLGKAVSLLEHE